MINCSRASHDARNPKGGMRSPRLSAPLPPPWHCGTKSGMEASINISSTPPETWLEQRRVPFERIGAPHTAEAVEQANALFDSDGPNKNQKKRQAQLKSFPESHLDKLDELDRFIFEDPEDSFLKIQRIWRNFSPTSRRRTGWKSRRPPSTLPNCGQPAANCVTMNMGVRCIDDCGGSRL